MDMTLFLYPRFHPRLKSIGAGYWENGKFIKEALWGWSDLSSFGSDHLRGTVNSVTGKAWPTHPHLTPKAGAQPWIGSNNYGNRLHHGHPDFKCARWACQGWAVWADTGCNDKWPATCKITSKSGKFFHLKQALTFDEAERECQKGGGHLASLHSQAEFDEVYAMVDGYDSWLGLSAGLTSLDRCTARGLLRLYDVSERRTPCSFYLFERH